MATILTKEKGVGFVVAKAENEIHKHILEKVGADKIVFPEAEMGTRLARNLIGSYGLNIIGVKRGDDLKVNLNPEKPMEKEMTLVIVGKNVDLAKIGVEV